ACPFSCRISFVLPGCCCFPLAARPRLRVSAGPAASPADVIENSSEFFPKVPNHAAAISDGRDWILPQSSGEPVLCFPVPDWTGGDSAGLFATSLSGGSLCAGLWIAGAV